MAFNPFTNFRKYQKFWMASILLLCMITFVLCTGTGQGDLGSRIQAMFTRRGTAYFVVDGRTVYSREAYDLKDRRNVANEYMRAASKIILARIDDFLKPENLKKLEDKGGAKEREQEIQKAREQRVRLDYRLRAPRFFGESGVKIEDLVNFKLWLAEADRLGIELTDEAVHVLTAGTLGREWYVDTVHRAALAESQHHNRVSEKLIFEALKDEYRVQLAQKVMGAVPGGERVGGIRISVTPGELWDFYKEKRVEYRLALLPMFVDDFVGKVPEPNDVELNILFEQGKNVPYDPAGEKPGFALPNQSKVAWISIDPKSDFYKRSSKLALELEAAPLPGLQMASWQVLGAQIAKSAAAQNMFDKMRGRYRSATLTEPGAELVIADYVSQRDPFALAAIIGSGARLDAGIAVMPADLAMGILRHKSEFEAGAAEVLKKRAPIYATLPGLAAAQQPFGVLAAWSRLADESEYLPLNLVQSELLEIEEHNLAEKWARRHMEEIKKRLDKISVYTARSIGDTIKHYVADVLHKPDQWQTSSIKDLGGEMRETKDFHTKYDIDQAKELEPLRKSFAAYAFEINQIEGRDLKPETALKEGDFWKMFFDGTESFAATGSKYQIKPWPPVVTINSMDVQNLRLVPDPNLLPSPRQRQAAQAVMLTEPGQAVPFNLFNDAARPFLFWRTADEPAFVPKSLDDKKDDNKDVRKRVAEAWKQNKARETVLLPRAKKIAESVEKNALPSLTLYQAMDELKKEYDVKREIIPLGPPSEHVSPLVPVTSGGGFQLQREYREFELPKDLFTYPRKEMASELLGLYDLKKPIEIGYPPLDEINKALYNAVAKEKEPQGKYVQILTNRPRTAFYIAAVTGPPDVNHFDFDLAVKNAIHDTLFLNAQAAAAKKLERDIIQQLRRIHKVEAPTEEIRKSFDTDAGT